MHTSHFFFFNDTATTEIYTLSLHDALPISAHDCSDGGLADALSECCFSSLNREAFGADIDITGEDDGITRLFSETPRSEEHTPELQSRLHLVFLLLLAQKKEPAYLRYTQSV